MPTVCGMCPVGCNTSVDMREGKAKRVRARNHHEIDEGWLCDKGRFAFTHLRSTDRIVDPIKRVRRRGFEPVSWDDAIDTAEELLRAAHGRVVVALSGSETIEQAYALAKLVRQGADSHDAVPARGSLRRARRLPPAALGDRRRAGRRRARRRAARGERADRRPLGAQGPPERRADRHSEDEVADADRIVLIWSGPGGRAGVRVAQLAEKLGLAGKEGCGAFFVPATPNGRGVADAWAAASDAEPGDDASRSAC